MSAAVVALIGFAVCVVLIWGGTELVVHVATTMYRRGYTDAERAMARKTAAEGHAALAASLVDATRDSTLGAELRARLSAGRN